MKQTNHLSNQSERLKVSNTLPKHLLTLLKNQEKLTKQLQEVLVLFVDESSVTHCQVVRYQEGRLVIATKLSTLSNHLLAIRPLLLEELKKRPSFEAIYEIAVI